MAIPFRYKNDMNFIFYLYHLFRTDAEYAMPGLLLAEELHCAFGDITCFRAASVDSITAAQTKVNEMITSLNALLFFEPWVPVINNILVLGQLYEIVQNVSFT